MVLSVIRSDFRELTISISNWLYYKRLSIKMRLAMNLADIKQKAFNKRYHVMILEIEGQDKLVSVNEQDIKRFKRKGWLPKNKGLLELQETSIFYSTPLSWNNKVAKEERRKAHKRYMKYAKKNKK